MADNDPVPGGPAARPAPRRGRFTGGWVLLGLAAGLAAGAALQAAPGLAQAPSLAWLWEVVEAVGGLWLNALRMTIVPLVVALLVVGVADAADAAATGRLAARAVALFALLLAGAAAYGTLAPNLLLALWPVDPAAAAALRGAGGAGAQQAAEGLAAAPSLGDWLRALAPANGLKAAAEDAILPLVVFAVALGFAVTQLRVESRRTLLDLFRAVAEAMVVIVRGVLVLAPLGVFGLAFGVGLRTGWAAAGALIHYVATVSLCIAGLILLTYVLLAVLRRPLGRFARAAAPVQALAISSQSSLACLPLMVERTQDALGVRPRTAALVLPLAVALFRITSPVGNLAVAYFVCHVAGVTPTPWAMAGAWAVSLAISVGSVGLPGQVSFLASVAPITVALGAPIELLAVLLAVEVAPDIFRTVGNITGDMAAAWLLDGAETDVADAGGERTPL